MEVIDNSKQTKFEAFHRENPKVYALYKKIALALIAAGKKRIGSKHIIELIRYESSIRTNGQDYKICNNHTPYYARRFVRDFPQHFDKFKFMQLIETMEEKLKRTNNYGNRLL